MNAAVLFHEIIARDLIVIRQQMGERCGQASRELKKASDSVLSGARSGRVYHGHTASAPGEPPAMDTGAFRASWTPSTQIGGDSFISRLASASPLAGPLEHGTGRMAPRPHQKRIAETAKPGVLRIYQQPYLNG